MQSYPRLMQGIWRISTSSSELVKLSSGLSSSSFTSSDELVSIIRRTSSSLLLSSLALLIYDLLISNGKSEFMRGRCNDLSKLLSN